jgi:hypothetical protein
VAFDTQLMLAGGAAAVVSLLLLLLLLLLLPLLQPSPIPPLRFLAGSLVATCSVRVRQSRLYTHARAQTVRGPDTASDHHPARDVSRWRCLCVQDVDCERVRICQRYCYVTLSHMVIQCHYITFCRRVCDSPCCSCSCCSGRCFSHRRCARHFPPYITVFTAFPPQHDHQLRRVSQSRRCVCVPGVHSTVGRRAGWGGADVRRVIQQQLRRGRSCCCFACACNRRCCRCRRRHVHLVRDASLQFFAWHLLLPVVS